eukprot:Gb_26999 [translate_table: standard]
MPLRPRLRATLPPPPRARTAMHRAHTIARPPGGDAQVANSSAAAKRTMPNDTLVNKPIVETTSNKTCKNSITVATTHLIQEKSKKYFMIVIAEQILEEIEYPVEHIINDTMHVTLKEKNEGFKLMEKLTQSSPS